MNSTPARALKGNVSHQTAILYLAHNGYIVFDNIYKVGPVDLNAMKDHEVILFDVKSVQKYSDDVKINKLKGKMIYRPKSDIQKELGVKFIYVDEEGVCKII